MLDNLLTIPSSLDFQVSVYLLYIVATTLIIISMKLIISFNLFENIVLLSVFSLLISMCYLLMDAPDVAMTEVALGSCLATCILLNFIKMLKTTSLIIKNNRIIPAVIICLLFSATLIWIMFDLPEYGDPTTALHTHLGKYYTTNTRIEIGTPSLAAGILASYRGYDTLGETSVILIAGLAVLLILSTTNKKYS
ncbi:Putative MnhB-like Na(+)/H(+) antiporter subunit B N-terminal domain protein [Candidatus Trichorickettsia mobilis]|uniref:MnhB-like Na(+)/H(+) antiporter subunit B N-terminal domain protein n=1 Tax=Candidatus Trichorickettsia mobilis TaxID=1346319 RepID=A0ABZ0URU9_9RICK|nr:DUF4040 domain-containing protein [Candidatus Trichorickettsia mobilis]WPY00236.1 Putative MnhB-like Na(+)/H(+) antiporter subunit B N-terminal domain protein [Candidatus Trichorickettsia mobilis]